MRLAILANKEQKDEILSVGISDDCRIYWLSSVEEIHKVSAVDALFDMLFEENEYDTSYFKSFSSGTVFVNSVNKTIEEIAGTVIRINGWPGFLQRSIAEVACADYTTRERAEKILSHLNKKTEWVPDIKGFISPRVVSMIINEAYFALEENVSTKNEIDIAMKLGTNYPYGPFEWAKKIGLKNIVSLLTELSLSEKRYQPAGLLLKEAIE
jgi:3-hydroxybutyryl-CoA dehydrogenase